MSFSVKKIQKEDPLLQLENPPLSKPEKNPHSFPGIQKKSRISAWILGIFSITLLFSFAFYGLQSFHIGESLLSLPNIGGKFFGTQFGKEEKPDLTLLLIGVGGQGHEGPDLTDTLQVAHISREKKIISLLSLPRDLWIEMPGGLSEGRINEVYNRSLRITGDKNKAMGELINTISELVNIPIDGYVKIDFDGFIDLVDNLGGVEIDIPESIVDTTYPDGNYGYETFRIQKGKQTLNGKTALKYARSRHSTSDFSRSSRQQLLIQGIRDKALSLDLLSSPTKATSLVQGILNNFESSLGIPEILELAYELKDVPKNQILSHYLNESCMNGVNLCKEGGLLYSPDRTLFGGAAVLLPEGATAGKVDFYKNLHIYTSIIFGQPELFLEKHEVRIINASKKTGVAATAAEHLKKLGFFLPEKNPIGSTKDSYTGSILYYTNTPGNPESIQSGSTTLSILKSMYPGLEQVEVETPKYATTPKPIIEIVLTSDIKKYETTK